MYVMCVCVCVCVCGSLCYTIGPCCLSILYVIVHICCPQTPIPSPLHAPCPLEATILFFMSMSLFCFIYKFIMSYFIFHIEVVSYGICLSLSDLFHLVGQSLDPSILLQWHYFILSYGRVFLKIFFLYFFLFQSIWGAIPGYHRPGGL